MAEKLGLEKVLLVGGHTNWQQKMKEYFPDCQLVSCNSSHLNASMLKNRKYIIMNTDILKHSCYHRMMSEKGKEQKILYVHGNNMRRCLEELERQLG